jgi:hypothetical protein
MTTHIFSFIVKKPCAVLKRRPWWNLFGRDSISYEDRWQSVVLGGLSEEQKNLLVDSLSPSMQLVLRAAGSEACNVMLEVDPHSVQTSFYVSTTGNQGFEGVKFERCATNLMSDSQDFWGIWK